MICSGNLPEHCDRHFLGQSEIDVNSSQNSMMSGRCRKFFDNLTV